MATYTQLGSITVQAVQWTGQALSTLPSWLQQTFLHQSAGNLDVQSRLGTISAKPTDWIVQEPDGSIIVMPNSSFTKLYH